jgi:hypothetical protein
LTIQLPPTKEIIVKVRDAKGIIMQASAVVFCEFEDEVKSLENHNQLFLSAMLNENLIVKM